MAKLKLKVITPAKVLFESDNVDAVYSTAVDGEFGVMPGHIPYMTPLAIGVSKYVKGSESRYISTIGGIFQVKNNEVLILTDEAEFGEDIDIPRAKAAKERAEALLTKQTKEDVDIHRAEIALAKALARMKAADKSR
ncbi:MAG: F0F1 ATP synthase subunit epsilon [Candidatus Gastranaerophilales bacterium]|nr:F0F1 ATP synthase subunit epsilon [Candidatus Gastranaerophilales bacterium]